MAALVLASFARQPEHHAAHGSLTSRHSEHKHHGHASGHLSSGPPKSSEREKKSSERKKSSKKEKKSSERQKTVKFIPGVAAEPQQPEHATLRVIAAGQSTTSTHWLQDTLCFYGMKTWHDHMICDPKPAHKGKKLDATAKRTEAKNQMRDFNDVETTKDLRFKLDHFVKYIQEERLSAIADFPVFYFFDELRTTFPRAAVLLSSRNATTWATARKLKNNLVCREAVSGSPMEAASAQMSPKLPHPFALMPCLERQLLRGEDPSLAFMHMSELQTNATGVAKLVAAFDAYNTHVRDSSDATKTPFVEIDVANPGTKEGDERIKNEALVKIAEILDPKVKELVKESLPSSGLNISELTDAMFGIPDVRPFDVAALISNASSPVAVVALKAAEALKADESNTSWFAALDTAVKANVTAEREAAAANTIFAARQQVAQQVMQEQATSAAVNAAVQPAAAVNQTASARADATVQEELVAQLRTGKALHAAERAAGEALAERAEAAVAAAERVAQRALAAKNNAMRNSSEAFDQAQAAAEEATAAAEVAAAERALAELKVAVGKATRDDQSSAALAEEKAAQNQLLADKAQAAAEASAAEAAAKADLQNAAADKVTEELAKKAESAAAAARAVQDAAAAVQDATEQKLGAIMSGVAATEQKLKNATEHRAEKEAAEQAVRDAMAAAPDHTLKVIAAGQSTTSTTWMQDTLCAFGLKTWHDHMMCVPEETTSNATSGGGLGHVPFHDHDEPMKRFGAFARKMAAHHRMEDLADIGSTDQLSSVLSRFKEFIVAERLSAVADFPVFYFFDELHEAFPRAAILLSVRNSTDWASARRMKNNLLCREAISDNPSPLAQQLEPALPHPFALLPCLARHLILGGRPDQAFVQASELQNNASGLAKLAAAFDAYNEHVRNVALLSQTPFAEMDVVNGLETDGLVKVAELLTGAPPAAQELATLTAGVVNALESNTVAAEYAKNETLPVAVICAEVDNSRHIEEFVEYHKSLGFSRIYAYDSGLTDESRAVLKSFAPETVTLLTAAPDEKSGSVDQCIRRISTDFGIEGPEKARQHVWIFTIDSDEFVSPFAVENSVPQVLASYEARGALHLHLEKVWFGGGWNKNVEACKAGPLLARFVRYGTQEQSRDGSDMHLAGARSAGTKIGKPAFSTRALPPMQALQAAFAGAPRLHMDQTLLQTSISADVEGAHGLVLHHFKPQSLEEYRAAAEFKQSQQKLRQRHPKKQSRKEAAKEARKEAAQLEAEHAWVNRTWAWSHNHTNGATHASMLLRIPAICRSFPRFAESLRECGLQDLCNDCHQLQEIHGCAREAEKPLQSVAGASAQVALHRMPTVDVIGSGAALVVGALTAAGVSAQSVDASQLTQVAAEGVRVQTDPDNREAVCAAYCEHTLVIDPKLVADEKTIVSMIRSWTGSSHWPHPFA